MKKRFSLLLLAICFMLAAWPLAAAAKVPADGSYTAELTLKGGTGRAKIESPVPLRVKNGQISAFIRWSSKNYSWMELDGKRYDRLPEEEYSCFEIPVRLDEEITFEAETLAMSEPHVISYSLYLDSASLLGEKSSSGISPYWLLLALPVLAAASGIIMKRKKKTEDENLRIKD